MFVFAKIMDVVLLPLNLTLFALLAASILSGRPRAWVVRVLAAVLLALAVLPIETWLVRPLEDRFPPPAEPAHVDGIVVLGGAVNPELSQARGQPALNFAAERVTEFMALALRHPEAKLVYSGGSGSVTRQELKEAPVARALLVSLGLDTGRVIFEQDSRNTWENAVYSSRLSQPKPGETWLLVTSAIHMPRAVGAFRAAGWQVVPYPVDYVTSGTGPEWRFNVNAGLWALETATHEWLGLAYYRWRGWSDALFPSPEPRL